LNSWPIWAIETDALLTNRSGGSFGIGVSVAVGVPGRNVAVGVAPVPVVAVAVAPVPVVALGVLVAAGSVVALGVLVTPGSVVALGVLVAPVPVVGVLVGGTEVLVGGTDVTGVPGSGVTRSTPIPLVGVASACWRGAAGAGCGLTQR
jgi:hypothetical protein